MNEQDITISIHERIISGILKTLTLSRRRIILVLSLPHFPLFGNLFVKLSGIEIVRHLSYLNVRSIRILDIFSTCTHNFLVL